jgi:hypothetical protein
MRASAQLQQMGPFAMELAWFARPEVPTLGLDLAEFRSGPAFFSKGFTAAGRPIWAKYRAGWLTVALEQPDEELLSVQIGPMFHWGMAAEQVCDLAGMTLRGERPVVTPEAIQKAQGMDWSGATTHLWQYVRVTSEGEALLQAATEELGRTWRVWFSVTRRSPGVNPRNALELPPGVETISTELQCLRAEIPTTDVEGLAAVDGRLRPLVFKAWNVIDLHDRERVKPIRSPRLGPAFSGDLLDWCAVSPDRFFNVHLAGDRARMMGLRPID